MNPLCGSLRVLYTYSKNAWKMSCVRLLSRALHLLYNCLSYLNLICQLEGEIFPYCTLIIARAYSDAEDI